jgi:hypothetical protein
MIGRHASSTWVWAERLRSNKAGTTKSRHIKRTIIFFVAAAYGRLTCLLPVASPKIMITFPSWADHKADHHQLTSCVPVSNSNTVEPGESSDSKLTAHNKPTQPQTTAELPKDKSKICLIHTQLLCTATLGLHQGYKCHLLRLPH